MNNRRLTGAVLAVSVAVATLLALPVASASADTSDPSSPPARELTQEQSDQLNQVATNHSALGVFSDASVPVVVLPAGTSAEQKASTVADLPAGTNAEVRISQFTKDALDALQVTATDRKWDADAGKYGVGTFYDAGQDKVVVQTEAPASVTDSLVTAHPGQIDVEQARLESQATRYDAPSPFWGGAALTNGGAKCTSGVTVESVFTGDRSLTTAAHCYQLGEIIYNRHTDGGIGIWMGNINARDTNLDTEFIHGAQYDAFLHAGGWERSTSSVFVHDAAASRLNLKVCVSGSVSFAHCGHPIIHNSYSWRFTGGDSGVTGGNGFLYDRGGINNGGPITQGGDSGAPIYVMDNTGSAAFIVGLHSGITYYWDGNICHCKKWVMAGVKLGPVLQNHSLGLVKR
ncbi:hypothetical protein [Lentzea sp. NPDC004782]|uniref:hypothetical protein n=1 Tax=Lentzea sp. NPDC004782 TaxID=3154458 RepID=UPI0033BE2320